jgi:hypothetical protein
MSVYFLRNTTTDEIVNRVEWDGVTEYTPEDGLELVLDTGSYFYTGSFPEITTTHYGGLFQGDFVGTSTGSFNGYSGSLDWLDAFATASRTGSFTGSLTGSLNGWSGSLDWIGNFPTASYRTGSFTGSFTGSLQGSSSYSETSSYFSSIKSGVINMGEWAVDMAFNYTASVNFSSSYSTGNYSIAITPAGDIRNFTITNKRLNGFNVDTNSGTPMTSDVYWIAIPYNNP